MNIKDLKEELLQEEAEEDLGLSTNSSKKVLEEFKIEEMPDIDIDMNDS